MDSWSDWFSHEQFILVSLMAPAGMVLIGDWTLIEGLFGIVGFGLLHQMVLSIRRFTRSDTTSLASAFLLNGIVLMVGLILLFSLTS